MYANNPIPLPFGRQEHAAKAGGAAEKQPAKPQRNGSACHPLAALLFWELLRG